MSIDNDKLWPRIPAMRYRLYAWRDDGHEVLGAASTMSGIGVAMQTLHEDQKAIGKTLADLGRIGVLDTCPDGEPNEHGEWIVLPFERGGVW